MKIVRTSLKMLTVSLALVMTGCGENISAGGPGTGGTGPIGPPILTFSDVQLMATNNLDSGAAKKHKPIVKPTDPANDSNLGSDSDKPGVIAPPIPATNPIDQPDIVVIPSPAHPKPTYQVTTINKSADTQYCQGFQRTITLIKQDKVVDKFTSQSDKPIGIQIEVVNSSDSNLNELQRGCMVFDVTDSKGSSVIEPTTQCQTPLETMQYLPKQTHKYNVQLSNLDTAGHYTVSFLNEVEGMQYPCLTFIEFSIE